MDRLKDKVALITGGSRGIGKAVALAFLREGARVAIAARSEDEIQDTVQELAKGGPIIGMAADVSRQEDVQRLVEQTLGHFQRIDILVNGAGIQGPIGPLVEVDFDQWSYNLRVNLSGTVLCCKSVLPGMMAQKGGRIINFSGGGATGPRPNFSAYACSKAAIVRFTETLAVEVRGYGIEVNAIAPGAVNTRMLAEVIMAGDRSGEKEYQEAVGRRDAGGTPPESAADLAVFLSSEESDGITGKLISAPWDLWRDEEFCQRLREERDLGTLRRIDGKYFGRTDEGG